MNLEHKLSRTAEAWFSEGALSPDRSEALRQLVKRRARSRRLHRMVRWGGVAAVLITMLLFRSALVSVAASLPVIGPIIAGWAKVDPGLDWAVRHGRLHAVGNTAKDQGYTFRIEAVLADAARTEIIYVVEGPGLTGSTPPLSLDVTYDGRLPRGGSGGTHEIVDGRLIGKVRLSPLPSAHALVVVTVTEIAGVNGHWEVSFSASRADLDEFTRIVDVSPGPTIEETGPMILPPNLVPPSASEAPASPPATPVPVPVAGLDPSAPEEPGTEQTQAADATWRGNGFALTVNRLILAPTQTIVELSGSVPQDFQITGAELVADGQVLPLLGASYHWGDVFRLTFARVEGDPAVITFRITEALEWLPGGPVIDLNQRGVQRIWPGFWFEVESVQTQNGQTVVTMLQGKEGQEATPQRDFRRWALVDAAGASHPVAWTSSRPDEDSGTWRMALTAEGEVSSSLRLESGSYARAVPDRFEVTIDIR